MLRDFPFIDSVIFDMDGTLWNASDSYATVWNECIEKFHLKGHVEGDDLLRYMGLSIDQIFDAGLIAPDPNLDRNLFLEAIKECEEDVMSRMGGVLFPGVYEGLQTLKEHYPLLLQSNCSAKGLENFMNYTKTRSFITDSLSWGQHPAPKSENIKLLMERNGLKHSIYVGDTQPDCNQAHAAGIPFFYMTYGFGECVDYDKAFDSFDALVEYLLTKIDKSEL